MHKKKILHLSMTKNIGGIASFQRNLFDNLNKDAIEFEFVTTYSDSAMFPYYDKNGVKIHKLPPQKTVIPYCISLYKLLKAEKYDAVHIHKNSCANPMGFIVCRMAGIKTIIAHSHSTSSIAGKGADIVHYFFRPLVRKLSHEKLACSPDAANWLYGKKYTEEHQVQIINNGIDTKKFSYNEKVRKDVRNEFGWNDKIVFGHVGNYIPPKNHNFMVDIIAEAIKLEKNAIMVFLGRGEAMEDVKRYAAEKGVTDNIVFMGAREDINRFYQALDVFLFPSLHEGFPIAGVEAQTADLPCLFSDRITSEILLTDRAQAMSLDEDAHLWAKKALELSEIMERRDLSEKISALGYDSCDMGRRMEQIYGYKQCDKQG